MISQNESGDSSATTRSAISAGAISITNASNQTQDVTSLSRDTTDTNGKVANTPDVNNVLNQQADTMQAAQAAGQTVAQGIGAYADKQQNDAQQQADAATAAGNADLAAQYQAVADSWAEGGTNRVGLHVAGGALVAGVGGGGIGSAAQGAAGAGTAAILAGKLNGVADSIGDATGSMTAENIASNVLAGLGGAVIAVGTTGAFAASNADLYNRSTGNEKGTGGTGSQALDWIGDQLSSAGRGAQNLADQFVALVNANGPQGSYVNPDDLNGPGGNSKPPATGGSAVPVAVCAPPLCAVVPAVTPGTPGYVPSNATLNSGSDDAKASTRNNSEASLPMGSKANQFNQPKNPAYQPTRNAAANVDGTDYAGHALDRMQDRGLTPSVIQNAIETGVATPSRGGATVFYDSTNNVSVVTNSSGKVVTVKYGK
ncbi:hypothetical protein LMG29739_00603 [Paraburkholderia solisilvae]|uniref:DUF4258 domain-containing protein n=2 Tax=Paraburkholderia solisilvae TaxID=624376 RepID=A0A6J5D3C0_9BURK|nr:hypothetical protein LMG29739_00603 [Paraburkholderia solisilvae]